MAKYSFDINEITLENIGTWPALVKVVACIFCAMVILATAYYFDISNQAITLDSAVRKEATLKQEFENKQRQSASLQAYKLQLQEIRQSFGALLRQLPSKTEVPGLLEDISKAGVASGLEFKLFDPAQEMYHDFYAELPISIAVIGNYHQLGDFVSRIAGLDRIVTLHDFQIKQFVPSTASGQKPDNKFQGDSLKNTLVMNLTAKTYRYIEDNEVKNGK